jgi:hypothetical protein
MKSRPKVALVLGGIVVPYMFAVVALAFYVAKHPGPVPRSISVSMLCFLILTIAVGAIGISRGSRKQAEFKTADESKLRRARAMKGMRLGLFVWGLIFLNGIRLVAEREVPWIYAIPGLTVDGLLFVVFWTSLKRLLKAEPKPAETGQQNT